MFIALLTLTAAVPAMDPGCTPQRPADQVATRVSKYDSVSTSIGTAKVTICYSRPLVNGRTIFGSELVPWDKLWRTGANEPTIIHTTGMIHVAGVMLNAGSYSLYTVPRASGEWDVVINRSITQWGHEGSYPSVEGEEVARAKVKVTALSQPVEALTMTFGNGNLLIDWEKTRVTVPFTTGGGHNGH